MAVLVSLALPWQTNRNEDAIIGFAAGALHIGLLAALAIAAVILRRHPKLVPFRERVLQAGAASALVALLATFMFIKNARVVKTLRSGGRISQTSEQWATLGAYIAVIAAGFMVYGAIKTYLDRRNLQD